MTISNLIERRQAIRPSLDEEAPIPVDMQVGLPPPISPIASLYLLQTSFQDARMKYLTLERKKRILLGLQHIYSREHEHEVKQQQGPYATMWITFAFCM
jgi:hypothetical protein